MATFDSDGKKTLPMRSVGTKTQFLRPINARPNKDGKPFAGQLQGVYKKYGKEKH